jgi:putative oxidoreductase
MRNLLALRDKALDKLNKAAWLGPALIRLTLGVVFIGTGWGKLHSLDKVTDFFTELHLPAPHFQAVLVASTELFGGAAILLGLLTRLAAIPLAVTMIVAIATAKRGDIDGLPSLLGFEEWSYLAMYVLLIVGGPGKLSLDHLLARWLGKRASSPAASDVGSAVANPAA